MYNMLVQLWEYCMTVGCEKPSLSSNEDGDVTNILT